MKERFDFVVIGSGLAGMAIALKVAEHGTVCLITKTRLEETNTSYAQGGIAAVMKKNDSYDKHVADTLDAGAGLCDEQVVRMVVSEGPARIQELIDWGTNFDRTATGEYDLAKEGGHSEFRILHHKDNTGFEIQRALAAKVRQHKRIKVLDYHFSVDLITQHHLGHTIARYQNDIECYGVYALDIRTNYVKTILGRATFVATGGIGNVYHVTTNPVIATGDGIAMVHRAKGIIENMEFVQFHPTSLYNPSERPSFLITEAMRGAGAILKTIDGKEFMHKYDRRESLAPRDIVARSIDTEIKMRGDDFVFLDARHINKEELESHFPNILSKCKSLGIDITTDMIPVVPAAHYACGGIKVDVNGCTSIRNLYAAGECSCTGLHGANRLASNSLLEAAVYAHRAAQHAIQQVANVHFNERIPQWNDEGTSSPEEMVLITQEFKELQQIMTNYVGIVRSNLRLKRAFDRLEIIYKETEDLFDRSTVSQRLCELRNTISIAYLVIKMARRRRESRGLHYNIDYPNMHQAL